MVLSCPRHCFFHVGSVKIETPVLASFFLLSDLAALNHEFSIPCNLFWAFVGDTFRIVISGISVFQRDAGDRYWVSTPGMIYVQFATCTDLWSKCRLYQSHTHHLVLFCFAFW